MRVQRNVLIPLPDGVALAGDLYLPEGEGRWPTIFSFTPYRKDDSAGSGHEHPRRYFTRHGYATLLVDLRGAGGSGGTLWPTFDAVHESADGAAVVDWAARQPWCDGTVGMWGKSYGGFTTLQTASRAPAALKAIVPIYPVQDIYLDFISPGGCPNMLGNYLRETRMLATDLAPPSLQDPAGRWLEVWQERLDRLGSGRNHALDWQRHADYDEHWRQRAVPVERIKAATLVIGGWRDLLSEGTLRAYTGIQAPKRLVMGPWVHGGPDTSSREPFDWLVLALRWFDHWLKGTPNGVMAEPPVTLHIQGEGRWRDERAWPLPGTEPRTFFAAPDGGLSAERPAEVGAETYRVDPAVGTTAGLWDPMALGVGYPIDQAPDDLRSLTFTSAPLAADLEISGSPVATIFAAIDGANDATLVAKLCDVAPSGASALITTGVLDAAHREGHDHRVPVEPGVVTRYEIPLWAMAYRVPRGHRLRLTLAGGDFPRLFPAAHNATFHVQRGGEGATLVVVPVAPERPEPAEPAAIPLPAPEEDRNPWRGTRAVTWRIAHDLANDGVSVTAGDVSATALPAGGQFRMRNEATASVRRAHPEAALVEGTAGVEIDLAAGQRVRIETRSRVTRTSTRMWARVTLDDFTLLERSWTGGADHT